MDAEDGCLSKLAKEERQGDLTLRRRVCLPLVPAVSAVRSLRGGSRERISLFHREVFMRMVFVTAFALAIPFLVSPLLRNSRSSRATSLQRFGAAMRHLRAM